MSRHFRGVGYTHPGRVRENNEDYWAQVEGEPCFVVADGMGGHQAGEVASRAAVEGMVNKLSQLLRMEGVQELPPEQFLALMGGVVEEVNVAVYTQSLEKRRLRGMGTTLVCGYFDAGRLLLAHVGDSRMYRLREGRLDCLTRDHSMIQELIDSGQLEREDVEEGLYKNMITRAIGLDPLVEPALAQHSVRAGDLFLLCTDGLTDMLEESEIASLLIENSDIDQAARQLITQANRRGGHDNITVVLVLCE